MNAKNIVGALLEDDGHSEHIKGWDRVKKWDGAAQSYIELRALQQQADAKYREMGQAIGIERALAHLGIQRADVDQWITGAQIGATHNYKRTVPAKVCQNMHCSGSGRPVANAAQEECTNCGEPLQTVQRPITPQELRNKYARWIVGVRLNDERTIWLKDPIPPRDHPTS